MLYLPLVIIKVPEAEAYNQVMSEPLDFSYKTLHNFLSFNLAKLRDDRHTREQALICLWSWSWSSFRCTHIEVKMQEAGERSGRGLWELLQQRLQVEFELLLPLLHQTLRVLPQHLLWRKQPPVHLLLCRQLKGNTHHIKTSSYYEKMPNNLCLQFLLCEDRWHVLHHCRLNIFGVRLLCVVQFTKQFINKPQK